MFLKKLFSKNGIFRLIISLLSFLLQIVWLLLLGTYLNRFSTVIALGVNILSFLFVLYIYNKHNSSTTFKLPWIILILVFPFIGILLYTITGKNVYTGKQIERYRRVQAQINVKNYDDSDLLETISKENKSISNQFYYLSKSCGFPLYENNNTEFFLYASACFFKQLMDLKNAKKFVFMEYHAIEQNSKCFSLVLDILKEKVKQGVEVRILYDDVGSIGFVNHGFRKELENIGIQCRVFNPISPFVRIFMNNRDHRKITVIDGKIGFTGGYNIADEYFGFKTPYGTWKDTGIRITGSAVNSLTKMFLEMWINPKKDTENVEKYFTYSATENIDGYLLPYSDTPLDEDYVGENVYMNMIKNSQNYVYITTPYLILDDEMKRELIQAVKRGIDVRIVTPGIPDKKVIYRITRSFYNELVLAGVRIYEYTPGFIHSKQVLVDDCLAAVGTINMDFRSFYHHFENGVLFYKTKAIENVKRDFIDLFTISKEVTEKYSTKRYRKTSVLDSFLRLFSSLL